MTDESRPAASARPGPLAARRQALGLTQEELANLLGVGTSAIEEWERGGGSAPAGPPPETAPEERPEPVDNPDVPRQLPAATANFTGRAAELDDLTRILDDADQGAPGALVISAIGGTAGIGKTALALHWAHQVKGRFPDGQLHVNLRGFDPSSDPVPPADAVRGFLDALGVPPGQIPRSTDAQVSLYRSRLADKQMLIVLDNARDEQQVRPLLPASSGCLVLITSRNQLTGLAVGEHARVITLDTLTPREAVRMLTSRLGHSRTEEDSSAVREIASLCAGLPLALSVVAARVNARPRFPLAALVAELRDTAGRLDALDLGDPQASVEAVFSWSYDQLAPDVARLFRLLGLHPGPGISVDAAASLSGVSRAVARRQLGELTRNSLISQGLPGRYAFHDLVRAYAARRAQDIDSETEHHAALNRVLGYYTRAARAAAVVLYPSREITTFTGQPDEGTLEDIDFDNAQQAQAWLESEHANLAAGVAIAAENGFDRHAWQLPWYLATHLARRCYWNEREPLLRTARAASERDGSVFGQAVSSRLLANVYVDLRDLDQAMACYKASADLYRQLGDLLGEAKAGQGIASVAGYQGRDLEAIRYLEYVLRIQQELGDKSGEARTLITIGSARAALGDIPVTLKLCRRALALAKEIGNRRIEERAWHSIGYTEQVAGRFTEAVAALLPALDLARKAEDRFHEADALAHLGDVHHMTGKAREARAFWSESLAIYDAIRHPDTDRIRAKLADPGPPGSPLPSDHLLVNETGQSRYIPWCSVLPLTQKKK